MSHANDILTTLKSLRADAESTAQRQHLDTALQLHQERHLERAMLQDARERAHDLQPEDFSPQLQRAYEISIRRAEIEWLYWAHRQTLEQGQIQAEDLECLNQELADDKARRLAELPATPALSLSEQETLLQALMCHAVEQYIDEALSQIEAA